MTALGPWRPLPLTAAVELFRSATFRWWVSGCLALELHTGTSWRDHEDTDVGIVRCDAQSLVEVLDGWDVSIASAGILTPWNGRPLDAARHENNLWCRPSPDAPWALDVTVGDGDALEWILRRDPMIRLPWPEAVLVTSDGVPYLAPELQLLFKSRQPRPKDELDAREVIPQLDVQRRHRLAGLLPSDHHWPRLTAG